jgi:hypothetical protein
MTVAPEPIGWKHQFDLESMTKDMLENLSKTIVIRLILSRYKVFSRRIVHIRSIFARKAKDAAAIRARVKDIFKDHKKRSNFH